MVESANDLRLYTAAQLDPAVTLDADAAWFTFLTALGEGWHMPVRLGDLDGDGAEEHGWFLRAEGRSMFDLCVLDPAPLADGGELAHTDAGLTCDGPFANFDALAVDHAVGDSAADLVVMAADADWTWSFLAYDGGALTTPTVIEPLFTSPDYNDYSWSGGFGADVLGMGARSLWTRWQHRDVGLWTVEVLYARTP